MTHEGRCRGRPGLDVAVVGPTFDGRFVPTVQEDGDGFDAEEVEDVGGAVDRFDLVAELQIGDPAWCHDLRRVGGGDIAITPSGMPSTMFTVKGSVAGGAVGVRHVRGHQWEVGAVEGRTERARIDSGATAGLHATELGEPFVQFVVADRGSSIFIRFRSSTVGSSLNIADSSADDPQLSPTEYSSELVAWLRSCVT